ncbi:MAG: xanthine dehydrogenase family protein subunit M [Rickettsiales bacterium]
MKSAPFHYRRMETLDELLGALAAYGEAASIIAGGQSLVPLMNLRMARPELLLDINRLTELSAIRVEGDTLVIGALARHAEVLQSEAVRRHAPLIAAALPHVGHEAIRNRGTFGGSVSLADPAAELPACCLALEARLELASLAGRRFVDAADYFLGSYETARKDDEVLLAAHIPALQADAVPYFQELSRRRGDYALAGLAAHARVAGGRFDDLRLVFFGVEDRPVRAMGAEAALAGTDGTDAAAAIAALDTDLEPIGDPQTSAEARRHLAGVLLRRAVAHWTEA